MKMPFGYNSFCFDHTFVIHTGKIRIKAEYPEILNALEHCTSLLIKPSGNEGQYTVISFTTTCLQTKDHLITEINKVLCEIMHKRIDNKYATKKWEPELTVHPFHWGEVKAQSVGKIDLSEFVAL
jgi:hypothetical protein